MKIDEDAVCVECNSGYVLYNAGESCKQALDNCKAYKTSLDADGFL